MSPTLLRIQDSSDAAATAGLASELPTEIPGVGRLYHTPRGPSIYERSKWTHCG